MTDAEMIEPEAVIHWVCPESRDGHAPVMVLVQRHDDAAGRQRRYVCPLCGIEITVNFPPVERHADRWSRQEQQRRDLQAEVADLKDRLAKAENEALRLRWSM